MRRTLKFGFGFGILLIAFATAIAVENTKVPVELLSIPLISVNDHEPISFEIKSSMKEGWEKTDKILELESSFEVSPKAKYVTNGEIYYVWAPPGKHYFRGHSLLINWTKQDAHKRQFEVNIEVKGNLPPEPPVPPEPPTPPVADNPFPAGKHCLIVEEQAIRNTLTPEQVEIFQSAEVAELLQSSNFFWRILDKDTVFVPNSVWKGPMEKSTELGPFRIVISNGKKWKKVALPASVAETVALIKEFVE